LNQTAYKISQDDDAVQRFNEDHIEVASAVKKKLFNITSSNRSVASRVSLHGKLQGNQDTLSRVSHASSRPLSSHSRIGINSRAFAKD